MGRLTAPVLVAVAAGALAAGCGGDGAGAGDSTTTAGHPVPAPAAPRAGGPLPGLPAATAGFMAWERLNRAPIPPDSAQARRVGVDAHRGVKNVYVRVPGGRPAGDGPLPDGTVVVKAAGEDPLRPTLVAVMRKVAGADPSHVDWRFAEYTRAAPGRPFEGPLTGAVCWSCHAVAAETDWVFTPR